MMDRPDLRLAVVDRGELAVRVLNVAHEPTSDDEKVAAVLVHDEPDGAPWYGREADELLAVAEIDPPDEEEAAAVAAALVEAEIDLVWLGALEHRDGLVAACTAAGLNVVGAVPPGKTPEIASGGAGTTGSSPSGRDEPVGRLVEYDVLVDDDGGVWCLDGRDVTVRHGDRPLLAEVPSAATDDDLDAQMRTVAVEAALNCDIRGALVVRLRHRQGGRDFELVECDVVAAPQHTTHEERCGVSIIGRRLAIASGAGLGGDAPQGDGVAVEVQLLAQDPAAGFVTEPAEVALLAFPSGAGVRIDASRRVGDRVDASDPLLGIVTAWGPDRRTALTRLRRALERTSVALTEGTTNRTLLLAVLRHPDVLSGNIDDRWFERHLDGLLHPPPNPSAVVLAAVEAYEADRGLAQTAFFAAAARGRPEPPRPVGERIELEYLGARVSTSVACVGPASYTVDVSLLDGEGAPIPGSHVAVDAQVDRLGEFERRITCGGLRRRGVVVPANAGFVIELDGDEHRVTRNDGIVVRAEWPALVVNVPVTVGQHIAAGDTIAVVESMKMEAPVAAPFSGVVMSIDVSPNNQVERGAPLLRVQPFNPLDPKDPDADSPSVGSNGAPELDFASLRADRAVTGALCERVYGPIGDYLLGFDLSDRGLRRLLTEQRRLAEVSPPADPALLRCEDGLLDVYADLGALYRPQTESQFDDDEAQDLLGATQENTQEYLTAFVQWLDADRAGLPDEYRRRLVKALSRYGVHSLERGPELEAALMWLFRSFGRLTELHGVVVAILQRRLQVRNELLPELGLADRVRLERLTSATQGRQQAVADLARDTLFHFFTEPAMEAASEATLAEMGDHLDRLMAHPDAPDRAARMGALLGCPQPLRNLLMRHWTAATDVAQAPADVTAARAVVAEVYLRRFYRIRELGEIHTARMDGHDVARTTYWNPDDSDGPRREHTELFVSVLPLGEIPDLAAAMTDGVTPSDSEPGLPGTVDLLAWREGETPPIDAVAEEVSELLARASFPASVERVLVAVVNSEGAAEAHLRTQSVVFVREAGQPWVEEQVYRNAHPMLTERLEMWRLANFDLERRPSPEDVYLYAGVAKDNPSDRRLFALAEVRDLTATVDPVTGEEHYPRLERMGLLALAAMRAELARYSARERPLANRLVLDITPPFTVPRQQVSAVAGRFRPLAQRVGLEKVVVKVRTPDDTAPGGLRSSVLHLEGVGQTVLVREDVAGDQPVKSLSPYRQKVLTAARFGVPYPYEIVRLLTRRGERDGRPGDRFLELDLAPRPEGADPHATDKLVVVDREPGRNDAHIVVGLITHYTEVVPEGITRVALLSDPTQGLGNLAEPECRRINAALAYALEHRLPVEWFAVSSGALISMDSGTENMDWIALTLRRLIEFTQAGGEINIVITGITVGGQPYWNAEATMLMHTKGILVMSPASTMVLTGKQALDFSGAVSAEDNHGIGGYERVMGPNGQAQYLAASFTEACDLLRHYYEITYVVPGERFPRRRPTSDPVERDVRSSPHAALAESAFTTIGDVFSAELNGDRKQPFDMRSVMAAVADSDQRPLERWRDLDDGDTVIVWETSVGGISVCMLGIESHTVPRRGYVPADGPPSWTSGTLFPESSRKAARAINAASGSRPLVVLANLSGFDGSPESMRRRQLEFGAEIGRAITNFDGPIVFVVVSRYHGGAFVVFSKALNEAMEIAAVEGSFASVIGGAPAAATVFAREVKKRTQNDERVRTASVEVAEASGPDAGALRAHLAAVSEAVRSEKLGEVADEFDAVHTIERAARVGSVDTIIPAIELRPYVVDALERGMARFGSTI